MVSRKQLWLDSVQLTDSTELIGSGGNSPEISSGLRKIPDPLQEIDLPAKRYFLIRSSDFFIMSPFFTAAGFSAAAS